MEECFLFDCLMYHNKNKLLHIYTSAVSYACVGDHLLCLNSALSSYVNATGVAPPTSPSRPGPGKSLFLLVCYATMIPYKFLYYLSDYIRIIVIAVPVFLVVFIVGVVVVLVLVIVCWKKPKFRVSNNMV